MNQLPDDLVLVFDEATPVQTAAPEQRVAVADDFVLGPIIPEATERNWLERNVTDPFARGMDQTGLAVQAGRVLTAGLSVGDFMDAVGQSEFNQKLNPMHPDDAALMEQLSSSEDWGDAARTILTNPQLIPQMIAQSLPASVPSIVGGTAAGIAGGLAGGPVGATLGGMAGSGIASGATEFMMSVKDALVENPAIASEAQLSELLQNDEFMGRVYEHAMKRGLGVGAFDAISFGVAGRVFRPVAAGVGRVVGPTAGRVTGATAEVGTQAAAGAGGEAAAQGLSEGKITSPGDVLMEGVAEIGTGLPEIAGSVLSRHGAQPEAQPAQPAQPEATALPDDLVLGPIEQVAPSTEQVAAPPAGPVQQPAVQTPPVQPVQPVQVQPQPQPEVTPIPADEDAPELEAEAEAETPPAAQTPPAPVPAATPAKRTEKVVTPNRDLELEVDWEVIDADQLKSADGQDQPRDRMRQGSDEQVTSNAARLDPFGLMGSRETDRGAPIIDDDNVILSGNGRTQSIMLAAEKHPERYQAYLASLQAEGFQTDGMKTPILVRRARGLAPENRRKFVTSSNAQGSMALAPSEQARVDRDYISDEMLSGFEPEVEGGVSAAANANFVRDFFQRMPQTEAAGLKNKDGSLSPVGAARIQNAIFARAYDDQRLIERATETDEDVSIRNALLGAAGAWANMRNKAPKWDITSDLVAALDLIKTARDAGQSVADYLNQIDAFADPVPEKVQQVARLFLNPKGTRLASGKDMRSRLTEYARTATDDSRADGDLLGDRAGPDEVLATMVEGIGKATDKTPPSGSKGAEPAQLFPGGSTLSTGPKRGAGRAPGRKAAAGAMLDAVNVPSVEDAQDADVTARKPQGTLAPQTEEVSYTNRQSIWREAWRAAGFTPDEGNLLPPARKRDVLRKLLLNTFGFKDLVLDAEKLRAKTPEAVNQMLDAYRNVRFMMHVLALPIKGVSLNGTLTLQLERDAGRYFGVYRPDARSIGLPGRSNSFAHEWAHALDHYLMDALNKSGKVGQLLSHAARAGGLDVTNSLEEAFAKFINAMFYDEAALAAKVFDLEQKADAVHKDGPKKGQPTKAALEAQAQIERLTKGASRLRLKPSQYRQQSADFMPGNAYFPSVHEMLARAFEAYVAHKLEAAGGTNEFVTKGEAAYLSDADARLAMTYPKGDDRLRIFAALDDVFDHLRVQAVLGKEAPAARPDDVDILDPQHWNKLALDLGEPGMFQRLKQEAFAFRNRAAKLFSPAAWKQDLSQIALNAGINRKALPQRVIDGLLDKARFITHTARGYMNARIRRNNKDAAAFMSFIWDRFATQPGSESTHIGSVYEEERERAALRVANEIDSLLKANGGRKGLTESEAETVRGLMYGDPAKGVDKQLVAIAAGLREIMEREYAAGTAAGIRMGYIENKGYLPRVLLTDKVQQNPTKFEQDAVKVYEIVYDNLTDDITPSDMIRLARETARRVDPLGNRQLYKAEMAKLRAAMKAQAEAEAALEADASLIDEATEAAEQTQEALAALVEAVRDDFAQVSAEDWRTAVVAGDSATYDAHGPATNFTKTRTLPPEADEILADWYETDPLNLVVDYAHKVTSRAAYVKRAGQTNGTKDLRDVIRRQDVKAAIQMRPGKYNPDTPAGRLAILRDLANPKTDNLLEMSIKEAERAGAYGPDVRQLRGMIEDMSGRRTRGPLADITQKLAGAAYVFTYIALLSRASITALTEPLSIMLRTGDAKVALHTFGAYLSEAVRASKTVQQRAALARAIGLTTTPLHDVILLNRLEADSAQMLRGNHLMARFFQANLLSQLTNAQRRAAMTGGFIWMQSMAQEHAATKNNARKKIIEAEFRELGIRTEDQRDFLQWLRQHDGLPELGDLDNKAGQLFSNAVSRFVDQTIQNPRRADKPVLAGNPVGMVAYSLTSFLFTFFSNVHARIVTKGQRDFRILREEGFGKGEALGAVGVDALWTFTSGFALIYIGQLVVTMAREAIFNAEQWEKKREDGELDEWIKSLAMSRTGIFGPGDVVLNALTGLRYERDLSNLFVGPGMSYIFSNLQNIARGMGLTGRNSPNTNTAEYEALKSAYRLFVTPVASAALSVVDVAGPIGYGTRFAGLSYMTSNSAANAFAEAFVGPKDK